MTTVLQIYIFYVTLLELQKLLEQSAERETSEKHSRVLKECWTLGHFYI